MAPLISFDEALALGELTDHDEIGELVEQMTRFTRWVNYLGLPALSCPCGRDGEGLPVGFQLLGRPFSDAALLRIGHAFQTVTEWHKARPAFRR